MKKVLVYGMTDNRGGIESYLFSYYQHFDRNRVHFDFVTDYDSIAFQEELTALGSKVYCIPKRRENLFAHMKMIRSLLKKNHYDALYCNLLSASGVFSALAGFGLKNVKVIVHSHNNHVENIGVHLKLRPILNAVTHVRLACSTMAADFMFGKKSTQAVLVNNAVDLSKYQFSQEIRNKIRKEFQIENKFVVGHVGRMCYQKNSLFLLDVFHELLKKEPNSVLLMIGNGEDRPLVDEKIEQLGIQDRVILTGMRNDVPQLLNAMDVFVLPSRFEGLSVVLVEAQAAGLDAVVTKGIMPDSCNISGKVSFVSPEEPPAVWADSILSHQGSERTDCHKAITKAGYEIHSAAKQLEQLFACL